MLPLSRLKMRPLIEHEPGSLVFAQCYSGVCVCLRVEMPLQADQREPGLMLLADAPWGPSEARRGQTGRRLRR